jgi:hypothetical protein
MAIGERQFRPGARVLKLATSGQAEELNLLPAFGRWPISGLPLLIVLVHAEMGGLDLGESV